MGKITADRARRIAERVRAMRLEASLTRVMFAEKLGVPRHVIADLEAGKIEPETDLIVYVAIVLGRRLRDCAEE